MGRKKFLLSGPDNTPYLYRNTSPMSKNQTSSVVDLMKWLDGEAFERTNFPSVEEAAWLRADLDEGDVLYTPPGWWHHVLSVDTSLSVLLPFDMVHPNECLSILQSL